MNLFKSLQDPNISSKEKLSLLEEANIFLKMQLIKIESNNPELQQEATDELLSLQKIFEKQ